MAPKTRTTKRTVAGTNDGKPVSVPLLKINRLPQMRELFDEEKVKNLALLIDKEGVLQDPGAVMLTGDKESREFLDIFNSVKKKNVQLSDLQATYINGKLVRCLLVFGEYRTRALLMIWHRGKPTLDGFLPQRAPGSYFRKRFGSDLVRLNCFKNGDAYAALSRQLAENTYSPPNPWEKATAETELFMFKKALAERQEEKYTVARHARERNQSYSTIRSLINWTVLLPEDIQEAVINGTIKYAISQQLLRACRWSTEHILSEAERKQWFDALVTESSKPRWTSSSFQKEVTDRISIWDKDEKAKQDGQWDLVSLMGESASRQNLAANRKRELGRDTELALRSLCSSVGTWKLFLQSGRLAPSHSPLLSGSVRRQIVRTVELLEELLEAGDWLASPEIKARLDELAVALPKCMATLDELYPNGDKLLAAND